MVDVWRDDGFPCCSPFRSCRASLLFLCCLFALGFEYDILDGWMDGLVKRKHCGYDTGDPWITLWNMACEWGALDRVGWMRRRKKPLGGWMEKWRNGWRHCLNCMLVCAVSSVYDINNEAGIKINTFSHPWLFSRLPSCLKKIASQVSFAALLSE